MENFLWPLWSRVKSARAPLKQPFMLHSKAIVPTVCVHVFIVHMLVVRDELHKAPWLHSWVDTWTGTTNAMCATATRTTKGPPQSVRVIWSCPATLPGRFFMCKSVTGFLWFVFCSHCKLLPTLWILECVYKSCGIQEGFPLNRWQQVFSLQWNSRLT